MTLSVFKIVSNNKNIIKYSLIICSFIQHFYLCVFCQILKKFPIMSFNLIEKYVINTL